MEKKNIRVIVGSGQSTSLGPTLFHVNKEEIKYALILNI
jgi:hypothetical protein